MLFEAVAVLLIIFLVFLMYVMVTPNSSASRKWAVSNVTSNNINEFYNNMFIGNDGTVYAFNGTHVNAISPKGQLLWSVPIPNLLTGSSSSNSSDNYTWYISSNGFTDQMTVTDNGTLYIGLTLSPQGSQQIGVELLAISSQGKLIWGKGFTSPEDRPWEFCAKNGYLYVISTGIPGNLTAYSSLGDIAWSISNVWSLPVVNDTGTVFILKGDGSELDAYTQDGVLLLQENISSYGLGEATLDDLSLPYNDHTIYIPLMNGLVALYDNGTLKWEYPYNMTAQDVTPSLPSQFDAFSSPFDANGNIYFSQGSGIISISPDGVETNVANIYSTWSYTPWINLEDRLMYNYSIINPLSSSGSSENTLSSSLLFSSMYGDKGLSDESDAMGDRTLDQLGDARISAINITTGQDAWNCTLPLYEHTTTLTASNYMSLVPYSDNIAQITRDNRETPAEWYQSNNITSGKKTVVGDSYIVMAMFNSTLYVDFWTFNYEVPSIFGQSECTYAGGIYAIDKNGTLIRYIPTDSIVSSMQENNGTIYYSTLNGKLYGNGINAITGLVLTAAVYIFLRFFLAGAVVRARKRIDSNINRNLVLKFINDNPGVNLYDITRSLNVSMGTVRYHLMILGINHRITSYKADDKFVRYFTNSGSYSMKQQLVLSLMRRDGINKVLNRLMERPGLTNIELSVELNMNESSTIRYLKELLANDIIIKEKTVDGRQAYFINNDFKDDIEFAVKVFPGNPNTLRIQHESPQ
jgi:predicted transcriptional regulator